MTTETTIDPFAQNRRLGRGVNIIGYDPLWNSRAEARIQEKHFRLISEAGFDHVRINLHPFKHMDVDDAIRPAWLETLDWALEQALSNGLMVILDMHEFNAIGDDPEGLKEKFLSVWRQLAPRYADAPNEVLFELLNEPCKELTWEMWNQYLQEALAIVRETNPTRTVIIGPAHWNNIDHLDRLELPEDDRNIISTVHYYRPMEFTHQGASWSEHQDQVGVEWRGTSDERQAVVDDLDQAQTWAEEHDRPLLLGEFGAYDAGDMDSRARYTSFVARQAEARGWSWSYWQFDSDFILYDIDNDGWIEPIRDALIPPQA